MTSIIERIQASLAARKESSPADIKTEALTAHDAERICASIIDALQIEEQFHLVNKEHLSESGRVETLHRVVSIPPSLPGRHEWFRASELNQSTEVPAALATLSWIKDAPPYDKSREQTIILLVYQLSGYIFRCCHGSLHRNLYPPAWWCAKHRQPVFQPSSQIIQFLVEDQLNPEPLLTELFDVHIDPVTKEPTFVVDQARELATEALAADFVQFLS